jgi:hypothetical protein
MTGVTWADSAIGRTTASMPISMLCSWRHDVAQD